MTDPKVKKQFQNLKTDKSLGQDGNDPRVLEECGSSLSKHLEIIYQESVDSGILPTDFKRANIKPIFKTGSHNLPENHRPVSITFQNMSIIRDEMLEFLDKN